MSSSCRISSFLAGAHHSVQLLSTVKSRPHLATKSSLGARAPSNGVVRYYNLYPEPKVNVTNTYVSPHAPPRLTLDRTRRGSGNRTANPRLTALIKQNRDLPTLRTGLDYERLGEESLKELLEVKQKHLVSHAQLKSMEYCLVEPVRDGLGGIVWPAPKQAMDSARDFIRHCVSEGEKVVIAPDKDADGLTSGVILHRTLVALGLPESKIAVHLISKGHSIHDESEREAISALNPSHIIVLDQGSRPGPAIVPNPSTRTLIIDHHQSSQFPDAAQILTACAHPPIATTSLLTYELCTPLLSPDQASSLAYLACIGTHGDLGNTLRWLPPFPDMKPVIKHYTAKAISDAIPLLNAPRRSPRYDVRTAWDALLASSAPRDLHTHARLLAARAEVKEAVERHTHTPPKFSRDGRIAVLRIKSDAQVHPVIATRWAGYLKSSKLEIVMCANEGYQEGMVNFSCRIAKCAIRAGKEVDIMGALEAAARLSEDGLRERMGQSFARGHREASGGIVPVEAFEELMRLLAVGEKVEKDTKSKPAKVEKSPQKNTLMSYFGKGTAIGKKQEKPSQTRSPSPRKIDSPSPAQKQTSSSQGSGADETPKKQRNNESEADSKTTSSTKRKPSRSPQRTSSSPSSITKEKSSSGAETLAKKRRRASASAASAALAPASS